MKDKRIVNRYPAIIMLLVLSVFVMCQGRVAFAAAYNLTCIDGTTISTTPSSPKKLNVLVFGRTTCYNTKSTISAISKSSWSSAENIGFIYADIDGADKATVTAYAKDYSSDIKFCYGNNNSAAWTLSGATGSVSLPFVIYIDDSGKVVKSVNGRQYADDIYEEISTILAGDAPMPDTPAVYKVQTLSSNRYLEARTIYAMINDFRTGADAWCWNEDNTTKKNCTGLKELTYDYELEKVAIQRAKELTVYYSHTRPNGEDSNSAYPRGAYSAYGENIACGYGTAKAVFEGWREDDEDYSGQGHRRNMLSDYYNAVGCACFEVEGRKCWVQEFGYKSSFTSENTTPTSYSDEVKKYDIDVSEGIIKAQTLKYESPIVLELNEEKNVDLSVYFYTGAAFPGKRVFLPTTVNVADTGIVSVESGKITGLKPGSTTITLSGKKGVETTFSEQVSVTVNPISVAKADVALSASEFEYTGKEIRPTVKVSLGDKVLVENKDYTLSYSNNVNAGTAAVTVEGIGNYGSTKKVSFTIKEKAKTDKDKKDTTKTGTDTTGTTKTGADTGDTTVTVTAGDKPAAATLGTVKNSAKKLVKVSWKAQFASGYEVQIALNSKFTKGKKTYTTAKTTFTVKKLKKGRTYYVRVRAFNKSGSKKHYGSFSKVKKIKVKK